MQDLKITGLKVCKIERSQDWRIVRLKDQMIERSQGYLCSKPKIIGFKNDQKQSNSTIFLCFSHFLCISQLNCCQMLVSIDFFSCLKQYSWIWVDLNVKKTWYKYFQKIPVIVKINKNFFFWSVTSISLYLFLFSGFYYGSQMNCTLS